MPRRWSDSDWGPESDSGSVTQPDHFPNSVGPNTPQYEVVFVDTAAQDLFGPGTMPFIADAGARKIYLADEGSMHVSIMTELDGLIGPLIRGYIEYRTGKVYLETQNENEREPIEEALSVYTGTHKFGNVKSDKAVCPACDELLSECECFKWGEGADWAQDPIDQSSLREMKPGIQAKRAKQWLPDESDVGKYMLGQCAAWAARHQQEHPHLRFGMDWEKIDPDDEDFGLIYDQTEDAELPEYQQGDEEEPDLNGYWRPQHIFTHDDKYFYDVEGAHPLSQLPQWDDYTLNHSLHDIEMTGMLEPGYAPTAEWIHRYAPTPKNHKTALTMYHVAPTSARESIQERGLTGQERGYDDEHLPRTWNYNWDQPSGNYFFPNRQDAYAYINALRQNGVFDDDEVFDIYAVDVDGLPVYVDPEARLVSDEDANLGGAWEEAQSGNKPFDPADSEENYFPESPGPARAVSPAPVDPDRLRIIDSGVPDGEDANALVDSWEFNEMPAPWPQLTMAEIPWPGHEARLSAQQKAAVWDKPIDQLDPVERAYVLDQPALSGMRD